MRKTASYQDLVHSTISQPSFKREFSLLLLLGYDLRIYLPFQRIGSTLINRRESYRGAPNGDERRFYLIKLAIFIIKPAKNSLPFSTTPRLTGFQLRSRKGKQWHYLCKKKKSLSWKWQLVLECHWNVNRIYLLQSQIPTIYPSSNTATETCWKDSMRKCTALPPLTMVAFNARNELIPAFHIFKVILRLK